MDLTQEEKTLQETARRFAEGRVRPIVEEHEAAHSFPREIAAEMGALGLFGAAFPQKYGGSGLGFQAHALVVEEISRVWSSLRALFNANGMTCAYTILKWGTEEQRERYVPALVRGEKIGLFGLTEPEAGSDAAGLRTQAVRRSGSYVLNGRKTWISHATVFDAGIMFARTWQDRHKGITAFIIEKGMKGLSASEIRPKLGHHGSPTGDLIFDDVEVPEGMRLGAEGQGWEIIMDALDRGRLSVGAGAVGVAQACLDESMSYAKTRVQFGKPIASFQMVQARIAEMATEVEAARLLVRGLGAALDRGEPCTLQAATAKIFASETAVRAANRAVEIHGGYGYSEEYRVARLFRDAKMYQVGEGTSNIQKLVIAKTLLGQD